MNNSSNGETNWNQSVGCLVLKENSVLLVRHTYGNGNNQLIIPGGYVNYGETPQAAVRREVFEETKVEVGVENIIAIRFNMHDWYVVFKASYVSGIAQSDLKENSEVIWVDLDDLNGHEDISELTKKIIENYIENPKGLNYLEYQTVTKHAPYSLYC